MIATIAIGLGVWIAFCVLLTVLNPAPNNPTKNMLPCLAALVVIFALGMLVTVAKAEPQTVIRDAGGRTIGTATTDSQGTTTFRNSGGSTTGTASRDSQGTTTFRDAGGRTTGTAIRQR